MLEITIEDIDIIGRIGPNVYIKTDQVTMISHQQTSQFIFYQHQHFLSGFFSIEDHLIFKYTYMYMYNST